MKFKLKDYDDIRAKVDGMSVRELVDAVSIPNFTPSDIGAAYGSRICFLHPGSLNDIEAKRKEIAARIGDAPMFVADFEFGCGQAIAQAVKFPSMYAFGRVNDPEAIYKIGLGTAAQGRRYGYVWSLAPCVDILMDSDSPTTATRAAGEDADSVIKTAGAYMRGMQDGGMIATLKHFPGDGATRYDQHLTTSENPLSMAEWRESYGRVYRELIENGAMSVMPGHIALPSYDDPDENGLYPPATLSKRLLTDLLRTELGFEGIIVSDAVEMSGFCGYMNLYSACARFLTAGGDLLLFSRPDEKMYSAFERFVEDGTLPIEILKNRAYRASCFVRFWQTKMSKIAPFDIDMNGLERYVVEHSTEIVRDRRGTLPFTLTADTRILHAVIVNEIDGYKPYEALDVRLRELCANVTTAVDPGCGMLKNAAESGDFDLVICSIGAPVTYGVNVARLHGALARNMMNGWTKLDTPVVFVNYSNPYLYKEYNAAMDAVINTYGISDSVPYAITRLLFGI